MNANERDSFFYSIKDNLYFLFTISGYKGEFAEIQKIKSKENGKYLLAHSEEQMMVKNRTIKKKISFEEYTDIVFNSVDICGVAIKVEDGYWYYDHLYLRKFRMAQEREQFLCKLNAVGDNIDEEKEKQIEECHKKQYIDCLHNVRKMWNKKAYERTYDILRFMNEVFPQNAGEVLFYCGKIHERVGNVVYAEMMYQEAIKNDRFNYWLYYQLGQFYRRIGKVNQERQVYETAYRHHRFYSNKGKVKNDGIQYVLEALIQHGGVKKKPLQKFGYMKYAEKIAEDYKLLPKINTYSYLTD